MKQQFINVFDSVSYADGVDYLVKCPIKEHYGGNYRLEYDGKYITLFGSHTGYKGFKWADDNPDWFEEMVLVPVVAECRNASPEIKEINDEYILVALNLKQKHEKN